MMKPRSAAADWRLLGLEPGATPEEILRAYDQRRALYDEDALASYSLLLDPERNGHLERLENARNRLLAQASAVVAGVEPAPVATAAGAGITALGPPPDLEQRPGAWLEHRRRQRGLTLEQLSSETRIRPAILEQLEQQQTEHLPAPVFVRGFVLQLARALRAPDPEAVAAAYLQLLREKK